MKRMVSDTIGLLAAGSPIPAQYISPQTPLERVGLVLLRLAVIVIFLVFGLQKFTLVEAQGIAPLVSHSPLTSWLGILGVQGQSRVIGTFELTFGALLTYGLWRPGSWAALAGAAGSCLCFVTTLSFLLTTPGVFAPNAAPILSGDTGLFLLKDIATLAASILFVAQGLAAWTDAAVRNRM